ncbi:MAG TPA: DUF2905 domain-containing protein [Candidatus Binataceae bacterium]
MLVIAGVLLIVAGVALGKLPGLGMLGRLPGDIYIQRGKFSFYFPLTTSVLISVTLTILFMLFRR